MSLAEAREATDTWLVELSGSLQFYPGMATLRSELLERAIGQYDRITQQNLAATTSSETAIAASENEPSEISSRHTDQLALLERAKASLRLGDLYRLTGKTEQAQQHYQAAESLLHSGVPKESAPHYKTGSSESLGLRVTRVSTSATADSQPSTMNSLERLFELERIHSLIGQLLISDQANAKLPSRERISEAQTWLRRVVDPLYASTPSDPDQNLDSFSARSASAYVRVEMAKRFAAIANQRSDCPWDEQTYEHAIEVARWLTHRRGTVGDRRLSENIQTENCRRLTQSGQPQLAAERWSVLIDDLNNWLSIDPDRIDYLQSLAHALLQRGNSFVVLGRRDEATDDFEASIRMLETAWRMTDDDGFYRLNLATAEINCWRMEAAGIPHSRPSCSVNHCRPTKHFCKNR